MSSGLGSRKPQIRYSSISDQHTLPLVGLHIGRIGCLLPIVVNVLAEMSRSAKDTAEDFVTRQAVPDQSAAQQLDRCNIWSLAYTEHSTHTSMSSALE